MSSRPCAASKKEIGPFVYLTPGDSVSKLIVQQFLVQLIGAVAVNAAIAIKGMITFL